MEALIGELPEPGSDWPVEKQMAWLDLMGRAFGIVYGGDVAQQLAAKPIDTTPTTLPAKFSAVKKPAKSKALQPYIIDENGHVMRANGERVLPGDVAGKVVQDMRGMGDNGPVIWADDSTGLNGADITITYA